MQDAIKDEEIMSVFEAAKWAPSSRNEQPWRFLYSLKDDEHWQNFVSIMNESNQRWAKNASALILVISKDNHDRDNSPNSMSSFDTGASWMSLSLQAKISGFATHAMGGIDRDKAKILLEIPQEYTVQCMVALGKQAPAENLPEDLRPREIPSSRRPLKDTVMKGKFRK